MALLAFALAGVIAAGLPEAHSGDQLIGTPQALAQGGSRTNVGLAGLLRWRSGRDLEQTVFKLRRAGAEYSREDFSWARVEVAPGRYDWRHLDRMMAAAARGGLRIIAIPNKPPAWFLRAGEEHTPPLTGDAHLGYVTFVRAAIKRYGTNGTFWARNPDLPRLPVELWDVWNEPYIDLTWPPKADAGEYARFFRSVVTRARRVDPNARFMLETRFSRAWLDEMFTAVPDLAQFVDAVSVHPYTVGPPDACEESVRHGRRGFCRLLDLRERLDGLAPGTPLWVTEVGWSTYEVSEAEQARNVHRVFELLREWGVVDGLVWYTYWTDERPHREGYFGLVRRDYRPKPAWDAFVAEAPKGIGAPAGR